MFRRDSHKWTLHPQIDEKKKNVKKFPQECPWSVILKVKLIVRCVLCESVAAYSASSTSLEHRLVEAASGRAPSVEV